MRSIRIRLNEVSFLLDNFGNVGSIVIVRQLGLSEKMMTITREIRPSICWAKHLKSFDCDCDDSLYIVIESPALLIE